MSSAAHEVFLLLPPVLLAIATANAQDLPPSLDVDRVRAVTEMLPERPEGLGRPLTDRPAWEALAATAAARQVITQAEALLNEPLPDMPDDLWLDYSRTGNRDRCQAVMWARRSRLTHFTLAECLENQGRFLPSLEEAIAALCAERTWVYPAHDGSLANFYGRTIDIDLASSNLGWTMALVDWLLGDRLKPQSRALIRDNVHRRVLDPFMAMVEGRRARNWWMTTTNNWNAVCLAGVTGAALALVEPREERARFVAAAEHYSRHFLAGFTSDGYCSEGLGYWNYGFGHYVLLAETIYQATRGRADLMARPEVQAPASFGARIGIIGGVYPAFADCSIHAQPAVTTMYYVNRRLGLGLSRYNELDLRAVMGSLVDACVFAFPNSASQTPPAPETAGPGLRDWFDQAGVLIGRPRPGSQCRMGVALKGGHNAEHHNHNDVGSYVVVLGSRPVLLDPGAERYTARTFSSRRYESKLLNSFGHPVPTVAGQLQRSGADARAQVLRTEFSDAADSLQLDITSAYPVPALTSLQRTFVYSRESAGSLTVSDHVTFASPQTFGTALLTLGKWQPRGPSSLVIYDVDQAVQVEIETGGVEFAIEPEQIKEDGAQPTRLGINLSQPVTEATVTVRITPLADLGSGGGLLRNGDFELQDWCWELPAEAMATVSSERAASGQYSLKIMDHSKDRGSNVRSARIPVAGGRKFELRGKVFHLAGSGVGMYVYYLDKEGAVLNPTDERGWIQPIGTLTGEVGKWVPFAFPFETPPNTAFIQVWIHSYSAADVEAFLDDLEMIPT